MAQPQHQMPPQLQLPQKPQVSVPQLGQGPQMGQVPQLSQLQQQPRFSPTTHTHSPSPTGTPQPGYGLPPNKRPRTDNHSPVLHHAQQQAQQHQPQHLQQNYATPQYSMPHPVQTQVQSAAASPSHAHSPAQYGASYGNGTSPAPTPTISMPPSTTTTPLATPTLPFPDTRQGNASSPSTPGPAMPQAQQQYTNAQMVPFNALPPQPPQGVMGPPSKPAERPAKEYEYDVSDSLAGTGIDLRAEEQFLTDYYAGSFGQEARTGFPANAPGGRQSLYGAGVANQPAQSADSDNQSQDAAVKAQAAWDKAAHDLAVMRSNEMKDPFLLQSTLYYKAEKIAKENGLELNLDIKNSALVGKPKQPHDFPQPKVAVSHVTGPDGALVLTTGSFIPHDAYLVDQLALLSIACKHRARELLEEAFRVAVLRQTTANGEIPEDWADAAVPVQPGLEDLDQTESILAPPANPLKRTHDMANATKTAPKQNNVTKTFRDMAEGDRKVEDNRLKKRQKRMNPDTVTAGSRAGSVVPGTPGADTEVKAPSKKEQKKNAALNKAAEAASTVNANQTLSTMMGGFGGRKKGKQYEWMKAAGSRPSTPRIGTPGTPGGSFSGGVGASQPVVEARLTAEPKTRWGTWRENVQGKNIQMRDWVAVLEVDGKDDKALQVAYAKLDAAGK